MKVRYLLTVNQIQAIKALTNIPGIILVGEVSKHVVEYDITSYQVTMLDSLLDQKGTIVNDESQWPSKGDEYYFISEMGGTKQDFWTTVNDTPTIVDISRRNIGNIFKTREEAEFELERLKVLNHLKNLSDDDQEWDGVNQHYHIIYNIDHHEFGVFAYASVKLLQEYWFKSEESAKAAIKTIGEDKLKKYLFNVKEKEN